MDNDKLAALDKAATQGKLTHHGWGDGSTQMGMTNIFNEDAEVLLMECVPEGDAAFLVSLWNAYRAGELVPVSLDADTAGLVERLEATKPMGMLAGCCDTVRPINPDGKEAATALRTITAERDALAKRVGDMRVQGQREGGRAVLSWLRERSARIPPASLWHAAEQLADQYEAMFIASLPPPSSAGNT